MNPGQSDDVISADPRSISGPAAALTAIVLLAAALAGAITVAVHYRGEAAALRHRQARPVTATAAPATGPLTLSSGTVALPSSGALNGEVTVFSARTSGRQAQIMPSAQISGARPHTRYELIGFDCEGSSPGYQTWATGVTGAGGQGDLTGHALPVSLSDYYWLYLRLPAARGPEPSLLGRFTATGKFSAAQAGNPACQ
ncbi:MAG: hypothetical protein ACRDPO_35765 [Streptosporangiaceae bacterium]